MMPQKNIYWKKAETAGQGMGRRKVIYEGNNQIHHCRYLQHRGKCSGAPAKSPVFFLAEAAKCPRGAV
jgi:hypothetical protein